MCQIGYKGVRIKRLASELAVLGVELLEWHSGKSPNHGASLVILFTQPVPDKAMRARSIVGGEYLCWSRMQTEAGQVLDEIVARKERERRAGGGTFFWGVGNAPAAITNVLARAALPVRVIFSVMKSRPKSVDVSPGRTFVWRRYLDANGAERLLPPYALITSRGDTAAGAKRVHYALMCRSDQTLELRRGELFDPSAFRNAGGTGAPVGFSQVTALLRRVEERHPRSGYEANLAAWLTGSYWVRLTDPLELDPRRHAVLAGLTNTDTRHWFEAVTDIRGGTQPEVGNDLRTGLLI